MADGSKAIDLIDRTAGVPGWIVHKPFPTAPSNCILPVEYAFWENRGPLLCSLYKVEVGAPGTIPWSAPNNGEGFTKDLSGNALPNAPHFTATLIADYTLPLPLDWLMTLHTDLYYQSEAWTRVFNTPGYDKLKAYNNVNVAAIFSNEDAGWQVMAYVKNVFDKDNITGAFLNSDDTGLTTNVFLNEPRLFGLRVTKNWTGSDWWSAHANRSGWYPYRLELDGDYGRSSGGREILVPAGTAYSPSNHPYPLGVQNDLDWGSGGGVTFVYQPEPKGWSLFGSVRYGRARGSAEEHPQWAPTGGYYANEKYTAAFKQMLPPDQQYYLYLHPAFKGLVNYATTTGRNEESHAMVDFAAGKDLGLGSWRDARTHLDAGFQYAKFRSSSNADLHGRPDMYFPPYGIFKYGGHWHRFWGTLDARREFEGAGPSLALSHSLRLLGDAGVTGRIDADFGLGGSVLFGKQSADVTGIVRGDYHYGFDQLTKYGPGVTTSNA
jgi:hypothetical protein